MCIKAIPFAGREGEREGERERERRHKMLFSSESFTVQKLTTCSSTHTIAKALVTHFSSEPFPLSAMDWFARNIKDYKRKFKTNFWIQNTIEYFLLIFLKTTTPSVRLHKSVIRKVCYITGVYVLANIQVFIWMRGLFLLLMMCFVNQIVSDNKMQNNLKFKASLNEKSKTYYYYYCYYW